MKNTPPRMFGDAPAPANENQKLIFMTVVAALLIVALITIKSTAGGTEEKLASNEKAEELAPDISIPELDMNILNALVSDKTEESRVIQEEEGREFLLDYTGRLADAHYRALKATILTAETTTQVTANPDEWRGQAIRMRGYIQEMREKARTDGGNYYTGTLLLDDGSQGHFVVDRLDRKDMAEGSSVRIDGIVMKSFRGEVGSKWVEAPLVVGRTAVHSFPALFTENVGEFTEAELAHIVNDSLLDGVGSLPATEKWKLLGRAAYSSDDVNWDEVEELDSALISRLLSDGDSYRGIPVRLPSTGVAVIAPSLDRVGENPARIDKVTDGWITDNPWLATVRAIRFIGPFELDYEVDENTIATGRGFFFKNLAFEGGDTALRRTPVLVLASLDELPKREENMLSYMMYTVFISCVGVCLLIYVLLKRDAKSSIQFQKRLAARKRKRPVEPAAS